MSRYVAIDWDRRELHWVAGHRRGRRLVVESLGALAAGENGADGFPDLQSVLDRGPVSPIPILPWRRPRTVVAVRRSAVELKRLLLPPAPAEDLPDLVRFQVLRDFPNLGDEGLVDFVTLSAERNEARKVLAAVVIEQRIAPLNKALAGAGSQAGRMVLRPLAAVSLLARQLEGASAGLRMLVDFLDGEIELTVFADSQVVFLRSMPWERSSGEGGGDSGAGSLDERVLAMEIRRTLTAAQNESGRSDVEAIYLWRKGALSDEWADHLGRLLPYQVRQIDPYEVPGLVFAVGPPATDTADRYAPLLGLLLDEVQRVEPAVDFLRRRGRRSIFQGSLAVVALLAAVLLSVVLGGVWAWNQKRGMDGELASASAQLARAELMLEPIRKTTKDAGPLVRWSGTEMIWLDELSDLIDKLPPPQEMLLEEMQLSADASAGTLTLSGRAASADAVSRLEQAIRDPRHRVDPLVSQQDKANPQYPWSFKSSLRIKEFTLDELVQRRTDEVQAAKSPATTGPVPANSETKQTSPQDEP